MFCTNCGNRLNSTEKFCGVCGNPVEKVNTSNHNTNNQKKLGILVITVIGIVLLGIIVFLGLQVSSMKKDLNVINQKQLDDDNTKEIQNLVIGVFNEKNESLNKLCLDNVCDQAIASFIDYLADSAGLNSNDINSSELEKTVLNTFVAYFENSENCNKVVNAITDCTTVTCDDIEINGDEASAYVYIDYVSVYDVDYSVWEDMLSETSIIGYLAGGWVDLGLQALDMLYKGDLSIYLDKFTDNCESSGSMRTYADEVELVKNEDGEWEIVDFPNGLFYAYYGILTE